MTDTLKLEGVGLDVRDGSSLRTLLEIDEFCLEPGEPKISDRLAV